MSFPRFLLLLLVLMLALVACNLPGGIQPPATETAVPATPPAPPLTLEMLKNGSYTPPLYEKPVTLVDGIHETGSSPNYIWVKLLDPVAFGDINGDGAEDAAILLAENGGGSGVFVSLVVILNQNGQPVQSGATLIDDRPRINSLTIQNGSMVVDAVIHGVNDNMANPTLGVRETYHFIQNRLTLTRYTSKTPDGLERAINIESPANGAEVSGSAQLKGNMPIGPFENNLAYRIYAITGEKLAEGPFSVQSEDMGKPATFDNSIDLSSIAPGRFIRIELADLSAANGSVLALDSILVLTK